MSERVLTTRELNRSLLARWLLLKRSGLSVPRALRYSPFERLPAGVDRELRDEAAGLVRFVEPDASVHVVIKGAAG